MLEILHAAGFNTDRIRLHGKNPGVKKTKKNKKKGSAGKKIKQAFSFPASPDRFLAGYIQSVFPGAWSISQKV
jgi:hypothetical protein